MNYRTGIRPCQPADQANRTSPEVLRFPAHRANPARRPQVTGPGRERLRSRRGRIAPQQPARTTRHPKLLLKRILLEYSLGCECTADAAWPPRARAKSRIRPETRLRRVL